MSKVVKIGISQETTDYINGVHINTKNRKKLLLFIAKELGVNSKEFKDYEKEYLEYEAEYDIIKDELQRIYVPETLNGHSFSWELDFNNSVLILTINCDCGIKLIEDGEVFFTPNFEDQLVSKFNN